MTDGIRERGRYYDIIIEALLDYDEWMKDDDYNSTTALNKIMKRMRERLEMSDPPLRSEVQTETPVRAEMSNLNDPERALVEKCKSEGFQSGAGCNLVDLVRRAGLTLSFRAAQAVQEPFAWRWNTRADQRWRVTVNRPVPTKLTAFDKIEPLYTSPIPSGSGK